MVTLTPHRTHPTPMTTLTPHRTHPTPATGTAVRLNLSTEAHTTRRHTMTTVIYRVTVAPNRDAAPRTVITVATRPHIRWTSRPASCTGGTTARCELGDLRGPRTLTFVLADAALPRHPTISASAETAGVRSCPATTVLVLPIRHTSRDMPAPSGIPARPGTSAPRGTHTPSAEHRGHTDRHTTPRATGHGTHHAHGRRTAEGPTGGPASDPPTEPPASRPASPSARTTPDATGTPNAQPTLDAGRKPSIAPPPGPSPTPTGAPAAMRPAADGADLPGGAGGIPLRKILGVLAASASFIGLVTAIALFRRRND